jgi:hypothetical protein
LQLYLDMTKRDIKEIGWEVVDWLDLPQDRDKWQFIANMNLSVPEDVENFLTG